MDGILIVDKPEAMTSAKAVAKIKSALKVRKIGHCGTLDPFATGILICCLNRATRLSRFFLEGDKVYRTTLVFGAETDTGDLTGKVVSEPKAIDTKNLSLERLTDVLQRYQGTIFQKAPMYSALKHQGVPLYKLARKGITVEKPPRQVTIQSIRVISVNLPEVEIEVACSAGTYIRTLATDVGRDMGVGAYLKSLRRIKSGGFGIDDALTLTDIRKLAKEGTIQRHVVDMADALAFMPKIRVNESMAVRIRNGQPVPQDMPRRNGPYLRVVDSVGQLVAVLATDNETKTYKYCCVIPKL